MGMNGLRTGQVVGVNAQTLPYYGHRSCLPSPPERWVGTVSTAGDCHTPAGNQVAQRLGYTLNGWPSWLK